MIETELTRKAMKIAFNAHKGQTDKGGAPYILHPAFVADRMEDEYACAVAMLHDVVEDTIVTFGELEEEFPAEIIQALKLLTRNKDEDYFDYIKKIKSNELAKQVKIVDLKHDSDLSRLETVTEKDIERRNKYLQAIEILNS